jgi:hypothetical protein
MPNFFNDIFGLLFMIELDYLRFTYEIIFIIIGRFFKKKKYEKGGSSLIILAQIYKIKEKLQFTL